VAELVEPAPLELAAGFVADSAAAGFDSVDGFASVDALPASPAGFSALFAFPLDA